MRHPRTVVSENWKQRMGSPTAAQAHHLEAVSRLQGRRKDTRQCVYLLPESGWRAEVTGRPERPELPGQNTAERGPAGSENPKDLLRVLPEQPAECRSGRVRGNCLRPRRQPPRSIRQKGTHLPHTRLFSPTTPKNFRMNKALITIDRRVLLQ